MNEQVYSHDHYYGYNTDDRPSRLHKLLIVVAVLLVLLGSQGCLHDDVNDIKEYTDLNLYENNRYYYREGIVTGLTVMNVPYEQAGEMADELADEVFTGE